MKVTKDDIDLHLEYVAESLYEMSTSEAQHVVTATVMSCELEGGSVASLFILLAGDFDPIKDFASNRVNIFSTAVWNDDLYDEIAKQGKREENYPSFLVTTDIPDRPDSISPLSTFTHPECRKMSIEVDPSKARFKLENMELSVYYCLTKREVGFNFVF